MEYSLLTRDDRGGEVLEPDVMTPEQFFGLLRQRSWQDGERRLMAAVLQDGIENFQKYAFATDPLGRELFDVERSWIVADDHALFSFTTVCEVLDIDPGCLRNGLLRWLEQRRHDPVRIEARHLGDPRRRVERVAVAAAG
ncbi:MAG: hypothetical protein AB1689_23000 [Thermodesulfobacteriota bacterium]